jgi:hypothetical protein
MMIRANPHWTVHVLGIAGMFAMLLGGLRLLSPDPHPLDLALFDFIVGLGEVALAARIACHTDC